MDGHDLTDAVSSHLGTWQEGDQHDGDEDGEEDLHDVIEEGGQVAHLHAARGDALSPEPHDGDRGQVHDEHDARHEQGEEPADRQGRRRQVLVGPVKDLPALALAHEGADDAHALDLLAHDEVDAVDARLHRLKVWQQPTHPQPDHHEQQRDEDQQQGGQRGVHAQGHDSAAHEHDRCHEHHGGDHEDDHLDLLDVIGGAGHQRGSAEARDLLGVEALDVVEDVSAHRPAQSHGGLGR